MNKLSLKPKQLHLVLLILALNLFQCANGQELREIPEQKLPLFEMIDEYYYQLGSGIETPDSVTLFIIPKFQISPFVTYAEYKNYLNEIKKDSSETYYQTQLPDSNISTDIKVYEAYLNSSKYDQYPVLGISWENAMNYCSWKNSLENISDTSYGAYRLPNTSEWISAYTYLKIQNIPSDMNNKYSDWLLSSYSESAYLFPIPNFYLDDTYSASKNDQPVYHRKRFIGNSYLFDQEKLLQANGYGYDYTGYRNVGFRIVKGQEINIFNRY